MASIYHFVDNPSLIMFTKCAPICGTAITEIFLYQIGTNLIATENYKVISKITLAICFNVVPSAKKYILFQIPKTHPHTEVV